MLKIFGNNNNMNNNRIRLGKNLINGNYYNKIMEKNLLLNYFLQNFSLLNKIYS